MGLFCLETPLRHPFERGPYQGPSFFGITPLKGFSVALGGWYLFLAHFNLRLWIMIRSLAALYEHILFFVHSFSY